MKRVLSVFLILLLGAFAANTVYAQKKSKVLLEIAGEKITVDEFMRVYKKNNTQGNVVDKKSVDEYLELFINFRLKVKQAEDLGMDTVPEFKEELAGYRKQLAKPYLIDKDIQEKMMRNAFEHMQYDVRASHILIKVGPNASPQDTAKAYNKIMELRKRILNGEPFGKVAVEASEDRSAQDRKQGNRTIPGNKGNLGYFTAFDMVYPFEKTVYALEPGELSMPVRTRFGYHLIRLEDKIPAIGTVKVAHIMLGNNVDSAQAFQQLDSIRQQIKAGDISFEDAAAQFSQDFRTKTKGGELPEFGSNRMVPSFIKAISELEVGGISKPVKTTYGTHLIKLLSKEVPGSWEEEKQSLKTKIARSDRMKEARNISAAKIREQYGFQVYTNIKDKVIALVDSNILTSDWELDLNKVPAATIFKIGDKEYSAKGFAVYLRDNQKRNGQGDAVRYAESVFDKYLDEQTMEFKDSRLEQEYPEFRHLVNEYRDGILLFNLMTEKIWSKAMKDTAGLENFYEKHKSEYMWDERLHASIYESNNQDAALFALQLAQQGLAPELIADTVNKVDEFQIAVKTRKFSKGDNAQIDKLKWEEGITEMKQENGKFVFIHKHAKLQPEPKKLNEARGLVIAQYQNYLEEQWIKELREKYEFSVNKKVLKKIK